MLNSVINLLLFPEFILSIGTVLILLIGTFLRNNSFSIISNLSIILLIFVGFIIFLNYEVFFWNYNNFFVKSKLINSDTLSPQAYISSNIALSLNPIGSFVSGASIKLSTSSSDMTFGSE